MNYSEQILTTAKQLGVLRPCDVKVPRTALSELVTQGVLEHTGRGLYQLSSHESSEHHSLVEVAVRIPKAVICLLSALEFYGIGTQSPHEVWITLDIRARKPQVKYPPIRVMRASDKSLNSGIEIHQIEGRQVRIYSIEKTIADCFKYRNKIGIDVAIEALKEATAQKRVNMDSLWKYAKICRVNNFIRPYLEML